MQAERNTSPLQASLRAEQISVEVGGKDYTIPAAPASAWIRALISPLNTWAVFPGMLPSTKFFEVVDGMAEGNILVGDVRRAALYAVRQASGRRWWEAMKLVGMVDSSESPIVGLLTLEGVNPETMPFGRWIAAVYALATRNADEKETLTFHAKLSMPPKDFDGAFEEDTSEEDFAAMVRMARQLPGMAGSGP